VVGTSTWKVLIVKNLVTSYRCVSSSIRKRHTVLETTGERSIVRCTFAGVAENIVSLFDGMEFLLSTFFFVFIGVIYKAQLTIRLLDILGCCSVTDLQDAVVVTGSATIATFF